MSQGGVSNRHAEHARLGQLETTAKGMPVYGSNDDLSHRFYPVVYGYCHLG